MLCCVVSAGTVVVADDSMVIRKIISRYLTASRVEHHLCCDGEEAWAWIQRHSSICAAVITDLEMPKMGGDTLVANMRDNFPEVPCFIVSGNDISLETLPRGARRAVVKPISSEQVQSIINEISLLQGND
jgi:CheY-like chemotaxis protein